MEKHKCKLCSRNFSNGRALGGHMKAHLATLPLPPKPHNPPFFPTSQSSFSFSSSYSSSSESEPEQQQQKQSNTETEHNKSVTFYGLRENPKKNFRFSDPEFSGSGDSVFVFAQDRESETESKNNTKMMMMTRQRSKRNRKITPNLQDDKKPKLSFVSEPPPPSQPPQHEAEPEPMVSSVSDASTEEDVAMCLMMLSRDTWKRKINNAAKHEQEQDQEEHDQNDEERGVFEIENVKKITEKKKTKKKNECEGCGKTFRSSRALGSHRSICCRGESGAAAAACGGGGERIFECPFCFKVFGSGQALGGHKRSHLMGISATASSSIVNDSVKKNSRESFIDLNLPAPVEGDGDDGGDDDGEFSAVSYVSDA